MRLYSVVVVERVTLSVVTSTVIIYVIYKEVSDMNETQIINLLLNKELEISSKINQTIGEILRFGYDKKRVTYLLETIQYSLDDIERIINR